MRNTQRGDRRSAPSGKPARAAISTSSGTEVIDDLSAARATDLGIPAIRLRWIAHWHERNRTTRHTRIAARLHQIADQMGGANDNIVRRRAA